MNEINKKLYEDSLNKRWSWITSDIKEKGKLVDTQLVLENSYREMVSKGLLPSKWLEESILEPIAKLEEAKRENGEAVITEDLIQEVQTSSAVGSFVIPKVMFPMIRRVMPELIANEIVSVQTLPAPTGAIFYMTTKYSNTKGDVTAGDEFSGNPYQTKPAFSTFYSSEKLGPIEVESVKKTIDEADVKAKVLNCLAFLSTDAYNSKAYKRLEIHDKTTHKSLLAKKVAISNGTIQFLTEDSQIVLGKIETTLTDSGIVKSVTSFTVTDKAKEILGDTDGKHNIVCFIVYNQEGTSHIPEMEFDIDHMDVTTTERKIKFRWTNEADQDMRAYHKISVEQEIVKTGSFQMNYEQDRELVGFIDDLVIDPLCSSFDWADDEGNGTTGNYLDRHRAMAQRMNQMRSKVAVYNRIAPADFCICSPQIASALQMLPDWDGSEISSHHTSFYHAGILGKGSCKVYCDPNRMNNDITFGMKPKDGTYGAGVVLSPYASWMSNTISDPNNFNNIRGCFNRYAITATPRAEFNYARVTVDNFAI